MPVKPTLKRPAPGNSGKVAAPKLKVSVDKANGGEKQTPKEKAEEERKARIAEAAPPP